jgi:hypothetical protein
LARYRRPGFECSDSGLDGFGELVMIVGDAGKFR